MPVGQVDQARRINDAPHCGCGPEVSAETSIRKNRYGREDWKITIRNDENHPVVVTLAIGECVEGHQDYDTVKRDVRIDAGCAESIEVPAHGNGYAKDSPFRITVLAECGDRLGAVEGKLHDC